MEEKMILYQIKSLEKNIMRIFINDNKSLIKNFHNMKHPTTTQHQIMRYIMEHRNEEIYQKDLEEVLNLRRATVSGVLQTMEKNNLIHRVIDDKDTRTKKIILNENSKKLFSKNEKKIKQLESVITNNISDEDLNKFLEVLQKMKDNIKEIN